MDSSADEEAYEENFEEICSAIASTISGEEVEAVPPWEEVKPPPEDEHPTIGRVIRDLRLAGCRPFWAYSRWTGILDGSLMAR